MVEIVTSGSQHPSRDWLGFVQTTHARHKIRNWLNAYERQRAIELGTAIAEKEFRRYKFNLKTHKGEEIQKALSSLKVDTIDEFHAQVGYGKLTPSQLISAIAPDEELKPREDSILQKTVRRLGLKADPRVIVKGMDNVMVYLAQCCKPIRGEEIVGYVTRGKGVSVHKTDCSNVRRLIFDPGRRIDVDWEKHGDRMYEATLLLDGDDRQGLLASITNAIADEKTNIRNVDARSSQEKGTGRISIVLDVRDRSHLEKVMARLSRLDGIRRVVRASH
jgi:guanosine-3',5'-bis(diphosphate) 3'-pyrophosphohydrolase